MLFKAKQLQALLKFSSQFALLYGSGLGFKESLIHLKQSLNQTVWQKNLNRMISRIDQGKSFAEALQVDRQLFEPFYVEMVKIGEASGQLSQVLQSLNQQYEAKLALRKSIMRALTYPCIIMVMMLVLSFGLCFAIVPRFKAIFASFHAPLPLPTRLLFAGVDFLSAHFILLAVLITLFGWGISRMLKANISSYLQDVRLFRIPIFGRFYQSCLLLRFCQILGLTVQAGLSVESALHLMQRLFQNTPFAKVIPLLLYDLRRGKRLTQLFKRHRYFPDICVSLLSLAELTGRLDTQLLSLAAIFQEEVDVTLERFKISIEPLMMLITGILVGGMVLAIYYPIFSLGNVV